MNAFEKRVRASTAAAVVGVDAGKYHHALVVRARGGEDSTPLTIATTRGGFEEAVAFIEGQLPGPDGLVLIGIEFAGSYGFTFAHYLRERGTRFHVVSVLASHTRRWKEVTHHQPLKTDAKDAAGICDLAAHGHFVTFPFLATDYCELRHLLGAREKLSTLRRGVITRLRALLDVVFPEFTTVFANPAGPTARAVLRQYPGPATLLSARRRPLLRLLARASRKHCGASTLDQLLACARATIALPSAQGVLSEEIPLLVERLELYETQTRMIEDKMERLVTALTSGRALLTVPNVGPVTAATFLGSIGDPAAYDSARQIVALAGLALVERSSGIILGRKHISKRGRPVLRKHAHLFAVRSVQQGGIFRAEFEALLSRNGNRSIPALTAIARRGLRLLYSIARSGRTWTSTPPGHAFEHDTMTLLAREAGSAQQSREAQTSIPGRVVRGDSERCVLAIAQKAMPA